MVKKFFSGCLLTVFCCYVFAGEEAKEDLLELKITGSPVITVFANYHAGIGEHNEESGFQITRAYLGYHFKLSNTLSGKVFVDAGIPPAEAASNEIVLKNAMLSWQDKGFTINAGLIGLLQFQLQEKFWNYRYIAQSFQDLYKMGPSADLGITTEYQFTPWISADLSFTNGEGYKKISQDNDYRYGVGVTIAPLPEFIVRAYADLYEQEHKKNQQTYSFFAGYKNKKGFSLGAEYNYQANQKFTDGNDYYGYSIYTNIPLAKKWNFFARYDNVDSNNIENQAWYVDARDLVISGFEYHPFKQLRISPNYKYAFNELVGSPIHEIYVNVGFNW